MDQIRERLRAFMNGRYGVDQLGRVLAGVSLALMILSVLFSRYSGLRSLLYTLSLIGFGYAIYRIVSTDFAKRREENQKVMKWLAEFGEKTNLTGYWVSFQKWFQKQRRIFSQRKDYHFYSCPNCHQTIRMPRGKGRVEITCPRCREKFTRNA